MPHIHTHSQPTDTVTFNCALLALMEWRVRQTTSEDTGTSLQCIPMPTVDICALLRRTYNNWSSTGRTQYNRPTDVSERLNLDKGAILLCSRAVFRLLQRDTDSESLSVQLIFAFPSQCLPFKAPFPSRLSSNNLNYIYFIIHFIFGSLINVKCRKVEHLTKGEDNNGKTMTVCG